jgi:hypothetical protein
MRLGIVREQLFSTSTKKWEFITKVIDTSEPVSVKEPVG